MGLVAPAQAGEHFVRVGKLGDGTRTDERRCLESAHAGADEGVNHLGLECGGDQARLHLKAVSRSDLGDRDPLAHRG